ncbi:MAG: HAMP domain-containing sensor histidine kinase [Propioniciclava sp.]|uniref:sensor histidine kinase n=1 Tax=Propioniciclava sp. TaxID=2038686 RepID=UPI0039E5022E
MAEVGVIVAIIALACAGGLGWLWRRERRRANLLAVENDRWRTLAQDRADRVAIVSHEVRTPLALIAGAVELLQDHAAGPLTGAQDGLIDTIAVKSHEVTELAADLLVDARIDAELFQFRSAQVDVHRLAHGVVRDLRRLYPNQITLSARGASPRIVGDAALLRKALSNLITNAARHAGTQARIAVTVRAAEDGVLIVVSDDGTGMTPDQTRELFRRGLAGKSETGHGLGMLITRRVVELHGGRCLVDSMVDHGTAILCSLPRAASARETDAAQGVTEAEVGV